MTKRKHTPEEIINKFREAEVVISSGSTVVEAVRRIGVSEQTLYRRRAEYGGLHIDQAPLRYGIIILRHNIGPGLEGPGPFAVNGLPEFDLEVRRAILNTAGL